MNTLESFIEKNLNNSNLFNSYFSEDRNLILNTLYNRNFKIENGLQFLDKFKSKYPKKQVLRNFEISKQRQEQRNKIDKPTSGDVFIDDKGDFYRLVNIYDNKFQFCNEGSFFIGTKGFVSMSGGFAFDVIVNQKEVNSIDAEDLIKVKQKFNRGFWFFMDNSSGANRGLHFDCNVNVYTTK